MTLGSRVDARCLVQVFIVLESIAFPETMACYVESLVGNRP